MMRSKNDPGETWILLGYCVTHVFYYLYSVVLTSGGLADPPSASQFLEMVKKKKKCPFSNANQPIQSPHSYHFLYRLSHTGPLSTRLIAPGLGTRQPGTAPAAQGLQKLFRPANPKPADLVSPLLSCRYPQDRLSPTVPFSLCMCPS